MTRPHDDHEHDELQERAEHDERLTLPVEQGVLLWCMRMWVLELRRGVGVEPRIEDMLDQLGVAAAAPCLKDLMSSLSRGCTRMIEVRCVCQKRIGADERALLEVLALAQAMRRFEAMLMLRGFVTPTTAQAALRSAEEIGTVLAQAGRFLPVPEQAARHFAMTQAAPPTRPAHETLH